MTLYRRCIDVEEAKGLMGNLFDEVKYYVFVFLDFRKESHCASRKQI